MGIVYWQISKGLPIELFLPFWDVPTKNTTLLTKKGVKAMDDKRIGYIRVSTIEQNTARQEEIMDALGVERLFMDKLSGKDTQRPELQAMLAYVREGDTLVVESISRLARSTKDFLEIMELLGKKGVTFVSQKENLDTSTPQGRFVMTIFAAVAELEREQLLQRQLEGIAIAKAEGKYKGRVRKAVDEKKLRSVCAQWREGKITAVDAMKLTALSSSTFYRRVKELKL